LVKGLADLSLLSDMGPPKYLVVRDLAQYTRRSESYVSGEFRGNALDCKTVARLKEREEVSRKEKKKAGRPKKKQYSGRQ